MAGVACYEGDTCVLKRQAKIGRNTASRLGVSE